MPSASITTQLPSTASLDFVSIITRQHLGEIDNWVQKQEDIITAFQRIHIKLSTWKHSKRAHLAETKGLPWSQGYHRQKHLAKKNYEQGPSRNSDRRRTYSSLKNQNEKAGKLIRRLFSETGQIEKVYIEKIHRAPTTQST